METLIQQNPCHVSASNATIHERNSDTWEFGKGALSATFHRAAVLQSKNSAAVKRKNVKDGGRRLRAKCQVPNNK